MKTIKIPLKNNPYKIFIGDGCFENLLEIIFKQKLNQNILVIIDRNVNTLYKKHIGKLFNSFPGKLNKLVLTSKESLKSYLSLEKIYASLLSKNYGRDTLIIAIGGGIIGDTAGFAAATFARGVQFVQVPTTLLAAVDSSVGGKTGVNFKYTKNIIGAFYQPNFVLLDLSFLNTLPKKEIICGLGEIVKYAFLSGESYFNFINNNIDNLANLKLKTINKVITESIKFKGNVVAADENEKGIRKVLNLGHTFAHAIEVEQQHKIKHGEAVIIGIVCSLFLSNRIGLINDENLANFISLPLKLRDKISIGHFDKSKILKIMRRDKKNMESRVKFVLVKSPGNIVIDAEAGRNDIFFAITNGIELFN